MRRNSTIPNQIQHDTARCDCEMCQFAKNSAQKRVKTRSEVVGLENQPAGFLEPEPENVSEGEYGSGIDIPAPSPPTFTHEWEAAPRSMTNYVEQSVAEWWFIRGQRAGELQSLTETTAVFRAMAERRGLG